MVSRSSKALYFAAMRTPMYLNGLLYKQLRQPTKPLKVHLGCGQKNYIPGWVNVDANRFTAKIDLWADFERRLPFRDRSVNSFYSFHVIEHFADASLPRHFQEMYRALGSGGVIRVGGPNIESACAKLLSGDLDWFPTFPDERSSIGGRFANFLFCRNEHLTALTGSYLEEIAGAAGFSEIKRCLPVKETNYDFEEVLPFEYEDDYEYPHTVMIEARKA
jgi:SAM-dependent methyltransferase